MGHIPRFSEYSDNLCNALQLSVYVNTLFKIFTKTNYVVSWLGAITKEMC